MMHRGSRHLRALYVTAIVLVSGVVTSTGPVETVSAADPPWTTPTVPPRCSSAQADSGNVAGCLLSANPGEPESRGWPSPPFPGESGGAFPGIGWRWTGSSYNGSPALAQWEAGFVSAAPCSVIGAEPPQFSNVNAVIGSPVANSAIVPVDPDGTFCVYISQPMHVVIDLMGSFSNSGLRFMPIAPKRVHDSRE